MLELRPGCETCDVDLPPAAINAMVCSFECTFCTDCATGLLHNVCPNCGGELVRRPVRPQLRLAVFPASTQRVSKPLLDECLDKHAALVQKYVGVDPQKR